MQLSYNRMAKPKKFWKTPQIKGSSFVKKTQADKFVKQCLFEDGSKNAYPDVWHKIYLSKKRSLNRQKISHKNEVYTR